MAGGQIADVSFVVPAQALKSLLSRHGVAFADEAKPSSAPSLIAKLDEVSKAVAMVEVSSEQMANNWKVVDVSIKSRQKTSRRGLRVPVGIPRNSETTSSKAKLVIDSSGRVIHSSKTQLLPGIMQDINTIGIFPLTQGSSKKWTDQNSLLVESETREREATNPLGIHFGRFGTSPRFGHVPFAPFSPFGRREQEVTKQTIRLVKINDNFGIKSEDSNLQVSQHRKIVSHALASDAAKESTSFRGMSTFSKNLGWTESGELAGKLSLKVDGREIETDVSLTFKAVSTELLAKEDKAREARKVELTKKREAMELARSAKAAVLDKLSSDAEPGFRGFHPPTELLAADADISKVKTPRVVATIPKSIGQGNTTISADGSMDAVANHHGLTLYRISKSDDAYEKFAQYRGGKNRVFGSHFLKFSRDGTRLIASELIGKTQVLEILDDGFRALSFFRRSEMVRVAPDGEHLAFYSKADKSLRVVNIDTSDLIFELVDQLYNREVSDIVFSSSAKELLVAQGPNCVLVDIDGGEILATKSWPFAKATGATFFAASGKYLVGSREAFEIQTGKSIDLPRHDHDCFAMSATGKWFIHLAKKFDESIQFHLVDGSELFRIDTGSKTGRWSAFDVAEDRNRLVAYEVFSDVVYVIEF